MMLGEVIALSIIIAKISKRRKVIEIDDEEEEDEVLHALEYSEDLSSVNLKNKMVIRRLS